MSADLESARHDWEDAYRRLEEAARDPARAEQLRLQLGVVTDELRKRVGSSFTLADLVTEYRDADSWARDTVSERAAAPGWPRTLSVVEGAAFHLYARGAVDYAP
ncbi:MAG: hypothetical protein A2Y55_10220 [Actinobacteria bacterium RBG_16_68_12]|nr:MAG: hypothetical protein A2Y55_10220 [Actinobacteria bacterium RBG_16_68_12]